MTRRMQANPDAPRAHHVEHDELWDCDRHPPCEPVKEKKPVTDLADTIKAVPRILGAPYADCVRRCDVLDVLKDTVAVPDTGTYIVEEGVVHKSTGSRSWCHDRLEWKITTELPPPPTFFEVGKKYTRGSGHRFEAHQVETNSDGSPVAIGIITWLNGDTEWVTKKDFHDWEEAR